MHISGRLTYREGLRLLHPLCIKASNQVEPHSHGLSHSPSSFFQLGTVTSPTLSCDGASLTLTTVRKHLRVGAVSRPRNKTVPSPCAGCSASSFRGTNSPQPKSQGVPVPQYIQTLSISRLVPSVYLDFPPVHIPSPFLASHQYRLPPSRGDLRLLTTVYIVATVTLITSDTLRN